MHTRRAVKINTIKNFKARRNYTINAWLKKINCAINAIKEINHLIALICFQKSYLQFATNEL